MQPIPFSDLYAGGDLCRRAQRNFDRLESAEYRPPRVFTAGEASWPADWEGRVLLALTLLAQATHREPRHLGAILEELPGHLNERGYLGPILPAGEFDEQQLSGHSWLLRAAVEHYRWRADATSEKLIHDMVHNLLLPARGYYAKYPIRPEERIQAGAAIGARTGQRIGHWYPSTDIGCAFIMMDGASQAYELLRLPELEELLWEMASQFAKIDLQAISAQTHATLSATRGLLRFHAVTGDAGLLALARRTYDFYRSEGMTENFANDNWFGRPDWTEPCAVIDSFLAAVELWRLTGEAAYLDDAHHILFNGMGYGQRPNGGFGCDLCAGARDVVLAPHPDLFEASWCCTMRGGEGLAKALEFAYFANEEALTLAIFQEGTARVTFAPGQTVLLRQWTDYPVGGRLTLEVLESTLTRPRRLRLFRPPWSPAGAVTLPRESEPVSAREANGFLELDWAMPRGARLEFSFDVPLRAVPVMGRHNLARHFAWRHGCLILGADAHQCGEGAAPGDAPRPLGAGRYAWGDPPLLLEPVNTLFERTPDQARADRRRILFPEPA